MKAEKLITADQARGERSSVNTRRASLSLPLRLKPFRKMASIFIL